MKVFNTTAVCVPSKHYMADPTERVKEIKKLVVGKNALSPKLPYPHPIVKTSEKIISICKSTI